jgi:hypothetical protein
LNEVFAEVVAVAAAWKDRAISRDGFLNRNWDVAGAGAAKVPDSVSMGCFPFEIFVSFSDIPASFELSEGLFLGFDLDDEMWGLACDRLGADLEDGVGDCGGSSSSVGEPSS